MVRSELILILFLFRLEHILGRSELRSDQRLFRFRLQLVLVRLFWLRVRVYLGTHRNAFMVSAASRFVSGSQEFSLLEKPFHLTKNYSGMFFAKPEAALGGGSCFPGGVRSCAGLDT